MNTEAEIIQRIWRRLGPGRKSRHWLRLGIGDDAAILRSRQSSGSDDELVLSCDAFLENIHFLLDTTPADAIGYKALVRATSDLAAMGATPRFFMLSLALPAGRSGKWLDAMLRGMARAAREFGMTLIGGDTSQNAHIVMNLTVGGDVSAGCALTRAGARPGDGIYVSGTLGAAQLGLELVLRGLHSYRRWKPLLEQHLRPKIQIELGRWLAGGRSGSSIASAATDTSDGLSTDLAHICQASGVNARIFAARIPTVELTAPLKRYRFDPLEMALHGGEDYQLLFTVPSALEYRIPKSFHGTRITRIGEILNSKPSRRSSPVELVTADGKKSALVPRGWDSFRGVSREAKH